MTEQEDFIANVNDDARQHAIQLITALGELRGENRAERAIALVGGTLKALRNGTLLSAAAALQSLHDQGLPLTGAECADALKDQVVP
jgi:hypothetical protein